MAPKSNENKQKYQSVLVSFLSRRDNVTYSRDEKFSEEHIRSITADDVVKWLKYKAYRTDTPTDDDKPVFARSTTLFFDKKAISSFIVNKHMKYNVETNTGNPTTAPAVNALIKDIKNTKFAQKVYRHKHVAIFPKTNFVC
jgi:hypothetical protein